MWIRTESAADHASIRAVVQAAFADSAHGDHGEARIVDALRGDGALTVSMVADLDGDVIAHIAVSPVSVDGKHLGWHGLGPVAVAPAHQGRGVGFALVQAALQQLRASGSAGCVVLGDSGYYRRFGFAPVDGLRYPHAPPGYFMAMAFGGTAPQGVVDYHAAFSA